MIPHCHRTRKANVALFILACNCFSLAAAVDEVSIERAEKSVLLKNRLVEMRFDLETCRYDLKNAETGQTVLRNAGLALGLSRMSGDNFKTPQEGRARVHEPIDLNTKLGRGKRLTLHVDDARNQCTKVYTFDLFSDLPCVVMGAGLINQGEQPLRVHFASPICDAEIYPEGTLENPMTLNGGAGDAPTMVSKAGKHRDLNSTMLTGKLGGKRVTIVAGGFIHREYIKEMDIAAEGGKTAMTAFMWDPLGRLVDPGTTYSSSDCLYLDAITADPFESLEDYGLRMRVANDVKLNYYDFPTFCGWAMSTSYLGVGGNYNNSKALVEIAREAHKDGLTRFTPVAVRLEPDTYLHQSETCSQGWYDDAHFRRFKKLVPPHQTFRAFSDDLVEAGALPFSYVQVNMPDPEFARAHPDWLLDGHEKRIKDKPGKYPPYRWDVTDTEFGKYMTGVWKRWAAAGLVGIKHDYPQTNWFVNGGFDDPHATTTSAYRKWFELCREGLGPQALIHERNLSRKEGVLSRQYMPALDACIGVNDLQRVSKDNSHLEPEFITKIALRWYKNRVVMNYYPDCKALTVNKTQDMPEDERRTILTLLTLVSGRLELATPYSHWTPAIKRDVSRVFPVLTTPQSPRPVDMLTGKKAPEVYVYQVNPSWSHVIFFNTDNPKSKGGQVSETRAISAPLSGNQADTGSLGLKADKEYYVYDFWGDRLVGRYHGKDRLSVNLKPCRSALYTIREAVPHPQVISCDRHLLQGQMELSGITWDAQTRTLKGSAAVVADDPMTITLAPNGANPRAAHMNSSPAKLLSDDRKDGLVRIELRHNKSETVAWDVRF